MKLMSIELENIRSYESGKTDFPEGSILLSGDIGSGKSTLLLATEFALFGIRRGELSGTSLLRRGKKQGFVRLTFSIDNKEIVIKRSLKRTGSTISQDSGKIIVDGTEHNLTPMELKAHILQYLGYPQDLLGKQKSLLYRYTVYTPQEELKRIMWAKTEDRLDSLRKVFGVDRYQLITENLDRFLGSLRSKKRELKGVYQDLDDKLETRTNLRTTLKDVKKNIDACEQKEISIEGELERWRKGKKGIENQITQYNEMKLKLATKQGLMTNAETRLQSVRKKTDEYQKAIEEIDNLQSPTDLPEKELEKQIDTLEKRIDKCVENPQGENKTIDALLEKMRGIAESLSDIETQRTEANTSIKNLKKATKELKSAGDICPICGKDLDKKHKDEKIAEYNTEIEALQKKQNDLQVELDNPSKEEQELAGNFKHEKDGLVKALREEKKKSQQLLDALLEYSKKIGTRPSLISEAETAAASEESLTGEIDNLGNEIGKLEKQIEKLEGVNQTKEEIEKNIERVTGELSDIVAQLATHRERKIQLNNQLKGLTQEIKRKKKARAFETKLSSLETWLGTHLMNLAGTIEKHYMVDLKQKFEPMFSQWFNLLIDDELLNVRIDDEFSPIIEQEGYEAEYENLSGGESASVALSYRLALNKVINTMVDDIKTRDLIILDEPTDGFSNDQMDKIRDVINELGAKQTIIVSHEPKIESYMDNIVRISKEDGVSRIAS